MQMTTTPASTQTPAYDLSGRNTYVATMPNGAIETRSSATMDYTHATAGCRNGKHYISAWHKSEAAAVKNSRTHGGTVVAVTAYPYGSPEARAARAATGKK